MNLQTQSLFSKRAWMNGASHLVTNIEKRVKEEKEVRIKKYFAPEVRKP